MRNTAAMRPAHQLPGTRAGVLRAIAIALAAIPALAASQPQPVTEPTAGAQVSTPSCRVLDTDLQLDYTGDCLNGLAHGYGVARGAHGAWYRGRFEAGKKSGQGVKLYPNGDGYTGQWRNDQRDGNGRYEYGPHSPWRGDVYQGGWRNDRMHGEGTYIFYPSGDRFSALWEDGGTQTVGTTTLTRRKQAYEILAPIIGQPGASVCSVTTEGAGPQRIARGTVTGVEGDRLQVHIQTPDVLAHSPDPELNPRWEVLTEWQPCP